MESGGRTQPFTPGPRRVPRAPEDFATYATTEAQGQALAQQTLDGKDH
jgi:hypothetical protein